MIDDDDKNLTRVMIGGAVLVNVLVFAVGYDAWGGDKEVYEIDCIRVAARIPC